MVMIWSTSRKTAETQSVIAARTVQTASYHLILSSSNILHLCLYSLSIGMMWRYTYVACFVICVTWILYHLSSASRRIENKTCINLRVYNPDSSDHFLRLYIDVRRSCTCRLNITIIVAGQLLQGLLAPSGMQGHPELNLD